MRSDFGMPNLVVETTARFERSGTGAGMRTSAGLGRDTNKRGMGDSGSGARGRASRVVACGGTAESRRGRAIGTDPCGPESGIPWSGTN